MKGARLISVYAAFLAMFGVVMGRLYLLAGNQDYASTARAQTVTTLELPRQRGDILDVEGRSLTGLSDQWYALALPGAALLTFLYYRLMAMGQFGGITGDTEGFFVQVCECVMVLALVLGQRIWEVLV